MDNGGETEKRGVQRPPEREPPQASSLVRESNDIHRQSSTYYHQNAISLNDVTPVDVQVKNITVSVFEGKRRPGGLFSSLRAKSKEPATDSAARSDASYVKPILQDVSAHMPSGSLTAILGSSGSGKTSLCVHFSHS
jgi:ABC-type multidrug transport system fused ATPase/permease subunit